MTSHTQVYKHVFLDFAEYERLVEIKKKTASTSEQN